MKYWAKNGEYNWICDSSEYAGDNGAKADSADAKFTVTVKNPYTVTNFWNNYDGSKLPTTGKENKVGENTVYAYGWKLGN